MYNHFELAVLKRIGRYEIQAELGRGGFGRVFRAFDPTVRRLVAIKVLSAESGERDMLIRFRNEAAAAGKLQHGNIVTIHDFGEQDGMPYIVMELLDGEDLQRVITGKRSLDLLAKVQIMSQIAQGLQYAHRHGIIHRDVKPANVMLLANGCVKIMDFGIALLTQTTGSRLTPLGSVVGTFRYMAPEQFMGSGSDLLSDIFSYGVIYYELVTGRHPFEAPEPARVMFQVMQAEPAPIREFCPECPDRLQAVVSRLLSKDRGLRYQNFEDVEFDVGPVLLDLKRARAGSLLLQAREALGGGQVDTAQGLIREVLDLNPAHPGARELRESVQAQLHRRAVLPRVNALLKSGQEHLQVRHYPEALRDFESALRLDEADSNIHALIEQARAAMEQARRVERLLSEASDALARQDLSAAYHSATGALQAEPQNPQAAALLQTIRQQIDQRDRERRLRDSLARAKGSVMLQSFDEAIGLLAALELEFPDSTEVGKLLQRARSEKEANERQQRLLSGMSAAKNAVRARCFGDAVAALESLASEFPDTPDVRELLAYAQDEMRAQERGEALGRVTRETKALLEKESYGEALEGLHTALQSYPGDLELLRLCDEAATGKIRYERSRALRSALETGNLLRSKRAFAEALQALDRFSAEYGKEPEIDNIRLQIEAEWKSDQRMAAVRKVLDQARDLVEQGRASAATQILTQAALQYPGERELTSLLETAHESARDQQRADTVRQICEQARALLSKEQFDAALESLDRGLAAYAGDESLTRLRASAMAARSERERQTAREKTVLRCKELHRQSRFAEASEAIEQALREFPQDPELAELKGEIARELARQKRLREIENAMREAASLAEQGLPGRAIALLDPLSGDAPAEPRVERLLAQCRAQLKVKNREDLLRAVGLLSAEQRIQDGIRKIDDAVARHEVENDAELIELSTRLEFELQQRERSLRREQDLAALKDISDRIATARKVRSLLNKALSLARSYSDDAEFQVRLARISAQAEQRATRLAETRKRLVFIGAAALLVVLIGGFFLYRIFRRPDLVTFEVYTDPPGATVRVGQTTCVTPNCSMQLQPGTYDVEAYLDGFQPSRVPMRLTRGAAPAPLEIRLQPSTPPLAEAHKTDRPGRAPAKPALKLDTAGATGQIPRPTSPKPLADAPRAEAGRRSNSPIGPQPDAHLKRTEMPVPTLPAPPVIPPSGTDLRPADPTGNGIKPIFPQPEVPPNPPPALHPLEQHATSQAVQAADDANTRGGDLYKRKRYEEAIVSFTEAIRLKPDFATAYFNRGAAYFQLGEFQSAIPDLDRTLALNPQDQRVALLKLQAQKKLASDIHFVGKDVTAPAYVSRTNPKYSKEAIRAGKTGTVLLNFVVDEYGHVKDCQVSKSLTPDLDRRAIDAASHWKFKPGTKHGKPVRVEVSVEVHFDPP